MTQPLLNFMDSDDSALRLAKKLCNEGNRVRALGKCWTFHDVARIIRKRDIQESRNIKPKVNSRNMRISTYQ